MNFSIESILFTVIAGGAWLAAISIFLVAVNPGDSVPFFLRNVIAPLVSKIDLLDHNRRDRRSSDETLPTSSSFSVMSIAFLFTIGVIGELIGQMAVEGGQLNPNTTCIVSKASAKFIDREKFEKARGEILEYDCPNGDFIDNFLSLLLIRGYGKHPL